MSLLIEEDGKGARKGRGLARGGDRLLKRGDCDVEKITTSKVGGVRGKENSAGEARLGTRGPGLPPI